VRCFGVAFLIAFSSGSAVRNSIGCSADGDNCSVTLCESRSAHMDIIGRTAYSALSAGYDPSCVLQV
jgi:hypothetical protein